MISMKVICNKLPSKKIACTVSIGTFDGIHLGHQFILQKLKKTAVQKNISSLVISFDIAPRQYLNQKHCPNSWKARKEFKGYITDNTDKALFISQQNIDYFWLLKSSQFLLRLSAKDFIAYIKQYFDIRGIIIGSDFRFGYKGKGTPRYLVKLGEQYGFKVSVIAKKKKNKKIISSSLIRDQIARGKLGEAAKFLGRNYSLKGQVVRGRGIGKGIGFPTANILSVDYILPGEGVYAAEVYLGLKRYLGAVNIGCQPTIAKNCKIVLEVYILGLRKNILGKCIKIVFLGKIRNERKFSSRIKLKAAISKDIAKITAKYSARLKVDTQVLVP